MISQEDVLFGQLISQSNEPNAIQYKGVFDGNNLYLYRKVRAGLGYRGKTYPEDGWVLAWSDIGEFTGSPGVLPSIPNFVPMEKVR